MNFIITSTAAVPMAAVAAVAVPVPDNVDLPILETASIAAADDHDVGTLTDKLVDAWGGQDAACKALSRAEAAMNEWDRRNPKPAAHSIAPPGTREAVLRGETQGGRLWINEDGRLVTNSWRVADVWKAHAAEALAKWQERRAAAAGQCGYDAVAAAVESAAGEVARLDDALCGIRAQTIAGVTAKARAAWLTGSDELREAAIRDLILLTRGDAFMAAA
jgi:hypothetical protein